MELLQQILKLIIMFAVPVCCSVVTYYIKKYINMICNSVLQDETAKFIKEGIDIILSAVNCVQQTYVDSLKNSGKFDKEAQKKALNMAKEKALELMNNNIQDAICNVYGNLDTYVTMIIESMVYQNKK